jgi:hypothetical protein
MTNRRRFFKQAGIGALTVSALSLEGFSNTEISKRKPFKHWVWINPDKNDTEEVLLQRYKRYFDAGIRGIFFEADSEKHFNIAKVVKIEAHRWIWTMNRGEKSLLSVHPEWYAKNRKGESCADKPPYVDYYRWLCPSRPEVKKYLEDEVKSQLSKGYVDGIHLDYVRFCDVILPVNLWDKYKIEQTKELPQYDYCYCEVCRAKFKELHGIDPLEIKYPEQSLSWRKFRYDRITEIVNHLSSVASGFKKPITAAVFPTPEVAKRNVRQDWTNWNLSAVCPMIYHGFYKEKVSWIGDAVEEGIKALHGNFPLYAGLFLPDFKNNSELGEGIKYALKNGASGVSFFGDLNEEVLKCLKFVSDSLAVEVGGK